MLRGDYAGGKEDIPGAGVPPSPDGLQRGEPALPFSGGYPEGTDYHQQRSGRRGQLGEFYFRGQGQSRGNQGQSRRIQARRPRAARAVRRGRGGELPDRQKRRRGRRGFRRRGRQEVPAELCQDREGVIIL